MQYRSSVYSKCLFLKNTTRCKSAVIIINEVSFKLTGAHIGNSIDVLRNRNTIADQSVNVIHVCRIFLSSVGHRYSCVHSDVFIEETEVVLNCPPSDKSLGKNRINIWNVFYFLSCSSHLDSKIISFHRFPSYDYFQPSPISYSHSPTLFFHIFRGLPPVFFSSSYPLILLFNTLSSDMQVLFLFLQRI